MSNPVVDFAVAVAGAQVDTATLRQLGLLYAPFEVFSPHWSLVFGRHKNEPAVWLVRGDQPASEEDIKKLLPNPPTWLLSNAIRGSVKPRKKPFDRAYLYGQKIGAWSSVCEGFAHPSPDTGDYFESERCFAPGVGITRLAFHSVWGNHALDLLAPPAEPGLPDSK